jgi:hypothetical protein
MIKNLLVIFLFLASTFSSFSQDGWAAYMMSGAVHKQLSAYAVPNDWIVKMSVWSANGVTPESFDLKGNIRTLMDGRFLEIYYTGEIAGMKYEALTHLGYNNLTKTFTHIDFNTFGTGFGIMEGTWNGFQKVASLKGQTQSPEDKKIITLRETIKFIGPDEIIFEVYDTREGQNEFKSLEYILSKRK